MATEQVSLRLDSELLGRIDGEAKRRGMTRTQMVDQALNSWLVRSEIAGGQLPAGFTHAFQELLGELAKSGGYLTILALDPMGRPWVFTGAVLQVNARAALDSGLLSIYVQESDQLARGPEVPIPRGSILAWSSRTEPAYRHRLGTFWRAIDGNDYVARGQAGMYRSGG